MDIPSPRYQPNDDDDEEIREMFVRRMRTIFLEMALHHPTMLVKDINDFVDKRMSLYSHVREDSEDESEVDINERLIDTLNKLINLINPSSSTTHHYSSASEDDSNSRDDTVGAGDTGTGTAQARPQQQQYTVDRNASTSSTVLLAENNLPNKQFTHPITEAKLNRYVSAVQSLSNSSTNYRENREAFDNRVKHTLDLYWAISTNSIQALAKSWRELDLSGFRQFVLEHVSSAAASAASNKSVDLQVKTLIQNGIVFIATIADIKIAWEEIPLATRNSKIGKDIQRELRKQIKEQNTHVGCITCHTAIVRTNLGVKVPKEYSSRLKAILIAPSDPPPREIKKNPHFNKKGEDLLSLTNDDSNTFIKMTATSVNG
jgi:hypothetical protein